MSITQPGLVDKTTNLVNDDTFIVYENASGLNKEVSYSTLINSITASLDPVTQLQLTNAVSSLTALISSSITTALQTKVYPVGSVYRSATSSTNPNSILGFGTWVLEGGYVEVGFVSGDADFGTLGQTGGAKTHNHGGLTGNTTLSVSQIPGHTHTYKDRYLFDNSLTLVGANTEYAGFAGIGNQGYDYDNDKFAYVVDNTQSTGDGGAHNHTITSASSLMPYKVFYRWIRTA